MSVSASDRFERGRLGAMLRAVHLIEDQQPWIFDDEVAARLSGFETDSSLSAALSSLQDKLALRHPHAPVQSLLREMRATVLLRSRYAEDQLASAVARGVSQYVILGSRFDSFAYRHREFESTLRIFEVDHPVALQRKQNRLRELHLTPFSKVFHVPYGFDGRSFWGALRDAGCNQEEPAYFSWLGASLHLPNEMILRTLEHIARAAPGSEVVFDYPADETRLDDERRQMAAIIKALFPAPNALPKKGAMPADPCVRLKALGFETASMFSTAEADQCFFADRTDELRCPQLTHLIKACVGESCVNESVMIPSTRAKPLINSHNRIGESPTWDSRQRRLIWVG
jgi:methyltransferase (TIGR00027 family)